MGVLSRWATRREERKRLEAVGRKYLQSVDDRSWTRIFDWTPGAFQTHDPYDAKNSVLAYPYTFVCITRIAGDIAKLPFLIQNWSQFDKIWNKADYQGLQALLNRPNRYQNHIQFKTQWAISKLTHGNTYGYKVRDARGAVESLHVLDPFKVYPLVAENGDVYYRLNQDYLTDLEEGQTVVPASEIIHDRANCLFHPLIGLSPIYACGIASEMGLNIQKSSKAFFKNGVAPSGMLTAPGSIDDSTALRLKKYWEEKFSGDNSGRVAVAGDGLEWTPLRMNNVDAQTIEHFKWSAETVCACFHMPLYKVGLGPMPSYNNIDALNVQYYTECLQTLIEAMEVSLADGIGLPQDYRVQVDIDGLFRMDQSSLIKAMSEASKAGMVSPDESRRRINLPPVPGGQYPYLQQQNYSLQALAARDATNPLIVPDQDPAPTTPPESEPLTVEEQMSYLAWKMERELRQYEH